MFKSIEAYRLEEKTRRLSRRSGLERIVHESNQRHALNPRSARTGNLSQFADLVFQNADLR
jgi:hypothetical protein